MYNRAAYNRQPYNRAGQTAGWNAAQANIRTSGAGGVTLSLALAGCPAAVTAYGSGRATWEKPVRALPAGLCFDAEAGNMLVGVPAQGNPAAMKTDASAAQLQLYAADDLRLEGLLFEPGDTLIIDTDRVTVEKNGVSVIYAWAAGSVPFRLAPGENVLVWQDDVRQREITCTVIWKDRWI